MAGNLSRLFKVFLLALALLLGINVPNIMEEGTAAKPDAASAPAKLAVKVLDIGQGDAILIQCEGENILIDTGDTEARDKLLQELKLAGADSLDKVILTHPHADHIGGMAAILGSMKVGEVLDNGMPSTSPLWRNYMKTLKTKNIPRRGLMEGEKIPIKGGEILVLYPDAKLVAAGQTKGYKHNPNNESVALKLTYGNFSLLATGDMEKEGEKALVERYGDKLKCNVLKSPHHGSKTSSTAAFLRAAAPEAVVISLGAGNSYGHPHEATLKKYDVIRANVYRTDKNGTVTINTDGKNYRIGCEKDASVH